MKNHWIRTRDDLFDPQLVRCVWDEELQGKRCFAADSLGELMDAVNSSRDDCLYGIVGRSATCDYPFLAKDGIFMRYAYYDPYYEMKLAYLNGAQIQYRNLEDNKWHSCTGPCWDTDTYEFRVEPEPKYEWRPFKDLSEMFGTLDPEGSEHGIWLSNKTHPNMSLLVHGVDHDDNTVLIGSGWYTMQELFEEYLLNGGPVGIKETKEDEE